MTADSARMDLPPQKDQSKGDVGDRLSSEAMATPKTDLAQLLGQQLRTAREAAGLTQKDAAEMAGVTKGRWSQMEGGISNINKLQDACKAIGAVLVVRVEVPAEVDV